MKVYIQWVDDKHIYKNIEVNPIYVKQVSGFEAMNTLFNQESCSDNKDNYSVVLFDRTDLIVTPRTACSTMAINTFACANFLWYIIDKEYVYEVLNELHIK